jgi:hypothetical protein
MTGKRCAYLTMQNPGGWTIDAELGFPPMRAMGWTIDSLPWRTPDVDWDLFDAVYCGTPWDYPEDPEQFMRVLESIDRSRAILVNDIALIRWTIPKTYLRDLDSKGAPVVPSIWGEHIDTASLDDAFNRFDSERIIVKPIISTNATDTFLLDRNRSPDLVKKLAETFVQRPFVMQAFMENIQSEGEFSLFYFNNRFSHFRAQEDHGAEIVAIDPEPALLDTADQVLQLVDPMPVYARADFVRGPDGRFLLMELELIEPSMYLRMDREAPQRFAEAFEEYISKMSGSLSV